MAGQTKSDKPKVSGLSGSRNDAETPFLQLRELVPLEHLRFATSNRVDGPYNGRHRSRTMGGSGEFADYRAYSAGDDLRRLDWRVLGRTGRAYIKQYQEDTNLSCLSVIDCSGSMMFDGREDPGPTSRWLRGRVDSLRKQTGLANSESSIRSDKLNYAQYFVTALTHSDRSRWRSSFVGFDRRWVASVSGTGQHGIARTPHLRSDRNDQAGDQV